VAELPSGTVTFLFTDLEGSTRLWEAYPEAMHDALARHDAILRGAIAARGGHLVKTTGDGVHAAFATAMGAVNAALDAQRSLTAESWGATGPLKVRMGLHTGSAVIRDGDYYGPALNRAARVMAAAHGGQVVCSEVTADMLRDEAIVDVELVDTGVHRLRGLGRPERIVQLAAVGLARDFPPLRTLDALPGNLPFQLTSFVGRDAELGEIEEVLRAARLVTLTGAGGVGKTRLALEIAAEVAARYRDGVWVCELGAADDVDALAQVVVATLGVTARPGLSLTASIAEFLAFKQLLVVLDNCEHLLDAASVLAEVVLQGCPDVRILSTSREALGLAAEHVVRVRSLSVPAAASLQSIQDSDAVRLFVDRAQAIGSGFELVSATASEVAEICRRLDGIPLAIELAAARMEAMTAADIAARLDERFRLLSGRRRGALERHQTLRATVDWSYSLLEENERLVFDALGVFPATFDAAAASAVAGDDDISEWGVIDALGGLVAKSMLAIDEGSESSTRYQMNETLRQYARERLDEAGQVDVCRRRHAEHFGALAQQIGLGIASPDELVWGRRLDHELDNLRSAVGWALDRDTDRDHELAVLIVAGLAITANSGPSEIGPWAERALPLLENATPGRRSAVLTTAGWHAFNAGQFDLAHKLVLDALREGVAPDWRAPASAYVLLGLIRILAGDVGEALAVLSTGERAIEARGHEDPWDLTMFATARPAFLGLAGDLDGAEQAGYEAIRVARQAKLPSAIAASVLTVVLSVWRAQPDLAESLVDESISLVRAGASGVVYGYTLAIQAQLRARAGDRVGALDSVREAIAYGFDKADLPMLALVFDRGFQALADLGENELASVIAGIALLGPLAAMSNLPAAELPDREQTLARLRTALGDAGYESAQKHGAQLAVDEAVRYSLAQLDRLR
jgi:predicted ATPase/class 3 adenylate cyclase